MDCILSCKDAEEACRTVSRLQIALPCRASERFDAALLTTPPR